MANGQGQDLSASAAGSLGRFSHAPRLSVEHVVQPVQGTGTARQCTAAAVPCKACAVPGRGCALYGRRAGLGSAAVAGEEAAQGKGLNKALQPQHHQGVFNAE